MKVLPADAVGMLNVPYEHDTGRKHGAARVIKIVHSKCHDRTCGEECMEFVARTVEFQDRTVGKPESHQIICLPGDRHADYISEQCDGFLQPITTDSDKSYLQYRH